MNNFRFAGQYYDSETGLHYNWHRYYDPKTGRYLTPDPIGLRGGINLYSYVFNNPINLNDIYGLFSCKPDGSVDPNGIPSTPSEGAAAWAQYQFEQKNKDFTKASTNPAYGGPGADKCNIFVREAFIQGGNLSDSELPKHYHKGKPGPHFAMANELADTTKNIDTLGVGDGSVGDIVAWPHPTRSGHAGVVGCNKKIYSATWDDIEKWNRTTIFSLNQITRYWFEDRPKIYRRYRGR